MKILAVIESYLPGVKGGGPVRALNNLVQHLGGEHEFFVYTRNHDYLDPEPYGRLSFDTWVSQGRSKVFYATPSRMRETFPEVVASLQPDWIYLQGALPPLTRMVLRWRKSGVIPQKLPVLLAPHGNLAPAALEHHALRKKAWLTYARLCGLYRGLIWHAASEREAAQIRQKMGKDAAIRIVPMAPPPLDVLPTPSSNPVATYMNYQVNLVYFGRISPEKNLPFAIALLCDWAERNPDLSITYDLIGPGNASYRRYLQYLAERAPENLTVHLEEEVPQQEMMDRIYNRKAYDALLMPSLTENFSFTVLESLLAGIPVLISDQTPWRDLVSKGVGWDLPLDQSLLWHEALDTLSRESPAERKARAERVRSFARDWVMGYPSEARGLFHPSKCSIGHEADD